MIEWKQATKTYGKVIALDDFTLTVEHPGIYCLLGRNGAGKTTLLKSLAGHLDLTSGTITVGEKKVDALHMPEGVHFIESTAPQFNMPLQALLQAAAELNTSFDLRFARILAERFELDLSKRYNAFSFGMKVMIHTLLGMASGKDILLLDEPVLGFDPVMRRTFYDLLQESCAQKPKIVIVSTHLADEMTRVAERLIILHKGRLTLYADMDEIGEKAYMVTGLAEHVQQATQGLRTLGEQQAGGFLSRYIYDRRIGATDKYSVSTLGLQDFFIGLVGDEKEVRA